ncbi:hypothetical protein CHS0354_021411 [Potamilus streckersoni]|uniref:Uncharacterized protein n=1 Tax=Potamilus streckersoni TaxID=2493646 RepID=A0AAE0S1J4_9BIVA|nr:hypothetical protein CHS0354_021411 [Potamilus streckersoni]
MLLSTVNLVSIKRTEKCYKKGKNKSGYENTGDDPKNNAEDQSRSPKQKEYNSPCEEVDQIPITVTVEDEVRGDGGEITSGYCSSESISTQNGKTESSRDLGIVYLATPDGYNIYLDPTHYFVTLKSQRQRTSCSTFRQVTLSCEEKQNGSSQLVAFHLASDSEYYLTTNRNRSLEIQMYQNSRPHLENPDERCFLLHRLSTGMVFIQPYHHRGYYIHHIDMEISIRKLEINFRPPEEFYFHIKPATTEKESKTIFTFDETMDVSHNADIGCYQEQEVTSNPEMRRYSDPKQDVNCGRENLLASNQLKTDFTQVLDGQTVDSVMEKCENITVQDQGNNYNNFTNSSDEQSGDKQFIPLRKKGSKKVKLSKRNSFCRTVNLGSCFGFAKNNEDSNVYSSSR